MVAQVQQLRACLDRIQPEHYKQGQQIARWREEWSRATPAVKQRLTDVDKVLLINGYYNGLRLLITEATNDLDVIKTICPPAFESTPATEPWLDSTKPAVPPPYS